MKKIITENLNLQASLEDLLVAHRVDLALYGHHHSYQRTCQVRSNDK